MHPSELIPRDVTFSSYGDTKLAQLAAWFRDFSTLYIRCESTRTVKIAVIPDLCVNCTPSRVPVTTFVPGVTTETATLPGSSQLEGDVEIALEISSGHRVERVKLTKRGVFKID